MEPTISINGGPQVPISTVKKVLRSMRKPEPRQTDIEDDALGHIPENDAKVGGIAEGRLRSLVERVERLEEERRELASDIRDIYAEAKSAGFDPKVLRQVLALRKKEPSEVEEQQSLLDLYCRALGM